MLTYIVNRVTLKNGEIIEGRPFIHENQEIYLLIDKAGEKHEINQNNISLIEGFKYI